MDGPRCTAFQVIVHIKKKSASSPAFDVSIFKILLANLIDPFPVTCQYGSAAVRWISSYEVS